MIEQSIDKMQIDFLVNYFKRAEKPEQDFKLGIELEHLIVNPDFTAVNFSGEQGVESILKELVVEGWVPNFEGQHLLGLKNEEAGVSLEPGGQLELSISPQQNIAEIENIYLSFLAELLPILNSKGKILLATGYQPVTPIAQIQLLPKERYKYMYDYFSTKGSYAHHMMKGTASIQVSLDYSDEQDYVRKFRAASFLSPLIYLIFDNVPYFAGKVCSADSMRAVIWDNCDQSRCGINQQAFHSNYGYSRYASFLLETAPIILKLGKRFVYTEDTLLKDLFIPGQFKGEEFEHLLTMVFPDVRTKKYIELRMGDALPYPYNMGYVAFWKGLLYNSSSLTSLLSIFEDIHWEEIVQLKEQIKYQGLNSVFRGRKIMDLFTDILEMAKRGLEDGEKKYLTVIEELAAQGVRPKDLILAKRDQGLERSLNWAVINDLSVVNEFKGGI